jgi:hypothetical protein
MQHAISHFERIQLTQHLNPSGLRPSSRVYLHVGFSFPRSEDEIQSALLLGKDEKKNSKSVIGETLARWRISFRSCRQRHRVIISPSEFFVSSKLSALFLRAEARHVFRQKY